MSNYIVKFQTRSDYESGRSGILLPGTVLIGENDEVIYLKKPLAIKYVSYYSGVQIQPSDKSLGFKDKNGNLLNITSNTMSGVNGTITFDGNPEELCGNNFYLNNFLVGIDLPKSIKKIGKRAFYNNDKLASITFPSQLEEIGEEAFYGTKITTLNDLPSTLKEIDSGLFIIVVL